MNDISFNILTVFIGGILGFLLNWFLAEKKERYELRRSIAPIRVEAYKSLWVLCKKDLKPGEQSERAQALWEWYHNGGGLFLSLKASERFFTAAKLLGNDKLSEYELKDLHDNLTWLRTEMKYHIGSYTKTEKKTQIKDAR